MTETNEYRLSLLKNRIFSNAYQPWDHSFLLIGYYFSKPSAVAAAKKAGDTSIEAYVPNKSSDHRCLIF